jgi:hypothetical protein
LISQRPSKHSYTAETPGFTQLKTMTLWFSQNTGSGNMSFIRKLDKEWGCSDQSINEESNLVRGCGGVWRKKFVVTHIETNSDRIVAIQLKNSSSEILSLECTFHAQTTL